MISFFSPAALHALGFIALLFMHSFCASTVTFQFTRDICKTAPFAKPSDGRLYRAFSAFRCFKCVCKTQCSFVASARRNAHEMALSTCIHANRFSCKHEICSQECTSELYHKKKADNITLPTFQPILFPSVRQHTEFLSGCNNCTTVSQPLRNISAYCFFLLRSNI